MRKRYGLCFGTGSVLVLVYEIGSQGREKKELRLGALVPKTESADRLACGAE